MVSEKKHFDMRGDQPVLNCCSLHHDVQGAMLVELCSAIPDGVVAFFTSYSYMESLICEWDAMGILRELTKSKLVFIETKDVVETTLALDNYRRACDCGRGAVFLSVARGKVSFVCACVSFFVHDGHGSNLVCCFGMHTCESRCRRESILIGITDEQWSCLAFRFSTR